MSVEVFEMLTFVVEFTMVFCRALTHVMKSLQGFLLLLFINSGCSIQSRPDLIKGYQTDKLIYKNDFEKITDDLIVETPPNKNSKVYATNNTLCIDVAAGATVWLNKQLSGNYLVQYSRTVKIDSGLNDRLSDFNQFWMASDPKKSNLFTRSGVFEEYDSLKMYYIGMGGNTNKTTRFRKYYGDGKKPLLQEYLDAEHLLKPNKEYHITLVVKNGLQEFYVDGRKYFSFKDNEPLKQGYFGFRTTQSRHEIKDFRIYSLK